MATKKQVAKKAAPAKKIAKPAARSKSAPKKAVKHATVSSGKASKPVSKSSGKAAKSAGKSRKAAHSVVQHKPVNKHADKKPVKAAVKSNHRAKTVEVKHAIKAPIAKPAKPEPMKEVKVPKTSVKTSVPYQPGYTPLEKRADSSKTNEPLVRYSDAELAEFKTLINKKLEAQILIGPEGDFTPKEIEHALKNNYVQISLGKNRLRSETAGVVAATLLMNC